jgi:AT hook motif
VLISFSLSQAPPPADANNADEQPTKRSRGRPKGSKNKPREGAASSAPATDGVKRKRGRPPKVGALLSVPFSSLIPSQERPAEAAGDDQADRPEKRRRGRPPKKPVQAPAEEDEDDAEEEGAASGAGPSAKKRGRPPKSN